MHRRRPSQTPTSPRTQNRDSRFFTALEKVKVLTARLSSCKFSSFFAHATFVDRATGLNRLAIPCCSATLAAQPLHDPERDSRITVVLGGKVLNIDFACTDIANPSIDVATLKTAYAIPNSKVDSSSGNSMSMNGVLADAIRTFPLWYYLMKLDNLALSEGDDGSRSSTPHRASPPGPAAPPDARTLDDPLQDIRASLKTHPRLPGISFATVVLSLTSPPSPPEIDPLPVYSTMPDAVRVEFILPVTRVVMSQSRMCTIKFVTDPFGAKNIPETPMMSFGTGCWRDMLLIIIGWYPDVTFATVAAVSIYGPSHGIEDCSQCSAIFLPCAHFSPRKDHCTIRAVVNGIQDRLLSSCRPVLLPRESMSFSTNRRKMPTRTSNGIANGMWCSTPSPGDICAICRVLSTRPPSGSDSCFSSRLPDGQRTLLNTF
ncbi:hypothetical protein C8Q80DRAFT_1120246 [Daedaleopsis nitida]|nr:hypothetical protein C8Q80DRAFT_1120246 [Daedaleopsis nitida]